MVFSDKEVISVDRNSLLPSAAVRGLSAPAAAAPHSSSCPWVDRMGDLRRFRLRCEWTCRRHVAWKAAQNPEYSRWASFWYTCESPGPGINRVDDYVSMMTSNRAFARAGHLEDVL